MSDFSNVIAGAWTDIANKVQAYVVAEAGDDMRAVSKFYANDIEVFCLNGEPFMAFGPLNLESNANDERFVVRWSKRVYDKEQLRQMFPAKFKSAS